MENNKLVNIITDDGRKEALVLDSREVAKMMGKEHKEILQYLEGRYDKNGKEKVTSIIKVLLSEHVHLANYFIESSYKDASGKTNKCYLCTKMGCELLGNKMKGEKGILFTAKYVERFNQMEEALKSKRPISYIEEAIKEQQMQIKEQQVQIEDLTNMVTNMCKGVKRIEDCVGIRSKTVFDYTSYIKRKLGIKRVNDDYENIKQCIFYEFSVKRWEQLTYDDEVMNRIDAICERVSHRKERKLF